MGHELKENELNFFLTQLALEFKMTKIVFIWKIRTHMLDFRELHLESVYTCFHFALFTMTNEFMGLAELTTLLS